MADWAGFFGLFGTLSIMVAMVVLGILSRRLGAVTRSPRYYRGFFVAAGLMGVSFLARLLNVGRGLEATIAMGHDPGWALLYVGLPSIAISLGVGVAWRYWSWLLAERG